MTATDLTKIDTIFGELDNATKGALLLAHHQGEVIEVCVIDDCVWESIKGPLFVPDHKYRVRPAPGVVGSATMHGGVFTVNLPTLGGVPVSGVYTSPDGLQIVVEVAQ